MYQEIAYCAWKEIPATYIYTKQDFAVPYDYQKSTITLMESERHKVPTFELNTGHCRNATMTQELVEIIDQIVSSQITA